MKKVFRTTKRRPVWIPRTKKTTKKTIWAPRSTKKKIPKKSIWVSRNPKKVTEKKSIWATRQPGQQKSPYRTTYQVYLLQGTRAKVVKRFSDPEEAQSWIEDARIKTPYNNYKLSHLDKRRGLF